ncbi:MAG: hypothetical protein ACPIOQ_40170, partial [Promethearchaeia archaeon]
MPISMRGMQSFNFLHRHISLHLRLRPSKKAPNILLELIAIILRINRRLKREMRNREALEQELRNKTKEKK